MSYDYHSVTGDAYYSANISLGNWLFEAMEQLDAAYWFDEPKIAWDTLPERDEDFWELEEDHPDDPKVVEYWRAHDALTGQRHEHVPGIPGWKIAGSNDDWFVSPAEILESLALIEASGGPQGLDEGHQGFWDRWVDFLRSAELLGGFRTG